MTQPGNTGDNIIKSNTTLLYSDVLLDAAEVNADIMRRQAEKASSSSADPKHFDPTAISWVNRPDCKWMVVSFAEPHRSVHEEYEDHCMKIFLNHMKEHAFKAIRDNPDEMDWDYFTNRYSEFKRRNVKILREGFEKIARKKKFMVHSLFRVFGTYHSEHDARRDCERIYKENPGKIDAIMVMPCDGWNLVNPPPHVANSADRGSELVNEYMDSYKHARAEMHNFANTRRLAAIAEAKRSGHVTDRIKGGLDKRNPYGSILSREEQLKEDITIDEMIENGDALTDFHSKYVDPKADMRLNITDIDDEMMEILKDIEKTESSQGTPINYEFLKTANRIRQTADRYAGRDAYEPIPVREE